MEKQQLKSCKSWKCEKINTENLSPKYFGGWQSETTLTFHVLLFITIMVEDLKW